MISEIPRRESSGLAEVTLQWTARKMALGWVGAVASPGGIRYLVLPRADRATVESEIADRFGPAALTDGQLSAASGHLDRLFGQLTEYFAGTRSEFDVAIDPVGTDFQRRVWKALLGIPFGQTKSYQEVGREIGCPNGPRAVGQAVGANPIGILIPCHRVLTSDKRIGGFGGGLPLKRKLLGIEGVTVD